jgi:formylglycine-generating enzyme required for sulfatase activity
MNRCFLGTVLFFAALGSRPSSLAQETKVRSYRGPNDHVLVMISGGTFTMGSPPGERGRSDEDIPALTLLQQPK